MHASADTRLETQVTNALKFENGLGVRVTTSCTAGVAESSGDEVAASCADADAAPRPATHTLFATVTDRGCGLTPQQCDRVFEAYVAGSTANAYAQLVPDARR